MFRARAIRRFGYSEDFEQAQRDGTKALEVLDETLKDRDWLAAAHPTIADIACFPYAALAPEGGFDLTGYRFICEWIDRFKRLPRFVAMPGIDIPAQKPSPSQF
jgi:glutathione S-transferase